MYFCARDLNSKSFYGLMVQIKEVLTDKDKKKFFRFPIDLYKDCDMYVPVLIVVN